jgi:hypothetical protein
MYYVAKYTGRDRQTDRQTDIVSATQLTRLCTAKMAVTTDPGLVYCVIHTHIICTKHNAWRVIGLSRLLAREHEGTRYYQPYNCCIYRIVPPDDEQ